MAKREAQARSEIPRKGVPVTLSSAAFTAPHKAEEEVEVEALAAPRIKATKAERNPKRERLYTDIGGAVIGIGGAAALLNFVLMK